ncbi:trafficking protein particle complex 2 [Coprinopsis cinerea okayama7|uniref:Trafficking protein particle complex subunit 2-like protein n=1 Tax=Coprinopsis cinerea (strain Okayama-7 / 130 / ATCC MYA-4618 / FGSC 9003) TaxID=240176 RepID=D6RMR4_COPC7|nr:trafficking protein particle complex 2 [Coprinopsis cinerea okayama7\|eukprot:XP_002911191.1 trafficking protein particle complex 2 [Coprinopsis cinerea okayama7\
MPPSLKLNAVAFISPQNHPILIRTFSENDEGQIKYHYIAHTSLDIIEERVGLKLPDCYLGLLYSMEDVAVYGYVTPLKVKIILAIALTDAVVKDSEVISIFKALHMAYYNAISNPFVARDRSSSDQQLHILAGNPKWKNFRKRVDDISQVVAGGQ